MDNNILIRTAEEKDIPVIFSLIIELAEYEKLADQIETAEEELKKTLLGKINL